MNIFQTGGFLQKLKFLKQHRSIFCTMRGQQTVDFSLITFGVIRKRRYLIYKHYRRQWLLTVIIQHGRFQN